MILPITPPPPSPVDLPWFPELRFTTLTTTPSSPHVCAATPIITASKHGQNTGSSCHKTCIPHLTFSVSSACPQFRVASWRLSFPLNHDPKTQIWINLFFSHTTKNEWYLKEKKNKYILGQIANITYSFFTLCNSALNLLMFLTHPTLFHSSLRERSCI